MSDSLEQLLRSTDAASPPPLGMADVAIAVRRRRIRRRCARYAGTTVAATVVIVFVALMTTRKPAPPPVAPIANAFSTPPAELSVQTLARLHELTVENLEHLRERRRAAKEIATLSAAPSPRELRDRAALIIIYDADQLLRASRRDDAVVGYQRAIELFPQSPWADVARARLKDLEA